MVASLFAHLPGWARGFLAEHNLDSAQQIQQQLSDVALKSGQYLAGSAFLIGKGTFGFTVQLRHYAVPAVLPAEGWAFTWCC
ncbi:membrane protein [Klebsiella variicola]|uniref:Membrane protein n=1 Tax=Klebsiella variicola TaxID=244366 RepID=A0A7H4MPF0_KLEVA|nr:membrane protein [Klebsiella variicola]